MSIQSEIVRLETTKTNLASAITEKGVAVPESAKLDAFPALVSAIEQGTPLPALSNPGTASDLAEGKQLIGATGEIVEGTVPVYGDGDELTIIGAPTTTSIEKNGVYLDVTTKLTKSAIASGSPTVKLKLLNGAVKLGNARPENVAEGITFSSTNGIKLTGTMGSIQNFVEVQTIADINSSAKHYGILLLFKNGSPVLSLDLGVNSEYQGIEIFSGICQTTFAATRRGVTLVIVDTTTGTPIVSIASMSDPITCLDNAYTVKLFYYSL